MIIDLTEMKERFRKNDTGTAMVTLKYAVDSIILSEALAKCNVSHLEKQKFLLGTQNYFTTVNNSFVNYFIIQGVWRNIRRIKKLDFVNNLLFECDRKPIIQAVPC
jgi:hypothetical protein